MLAFVRFCLILSENDGQRSSFSSEKREVEGVTSSSGPKDCEMIERGPKDCEMIGSGLRSLCYILPTHRRKSVIITILYFLTLVYTVLQN